MDIKLFIGVIKRFKKLVIGGFFLAIVLAVFSYGTPGTKGGKPTVIPRGTETWQSQAQLLITQASFPYGRAAQQYTGGKGGIPAAPVGDQSYMSNLAPIYAALANGSTVQHLIAKAAPGAGSVAATQVINTATSFGEPFVDLTATAHSAQAAAKLAQTASTVLVNYVTQQQNRAGIAASDRVQLQVVQSGATPQMTSGPSKSVPLLVFVAVLGAAIALAFMKENADPQTAAALGRVRAPGHPEPVGALGAHPGGLRVAEPTGPAEGDAAAGSGAGDGSDLWPASSPPPSKRVMELLIRDRQRPRSADSEG
jgi:hypothetical protein